MRRSWEVSTVPEAGWSGGTGKGNRNPVIYADEKSDAPIVPKKSPNKGQTSFLFEERTAEAMEGRG